MSQEIPGPPGDVRHSLGTGGRHAGGAPAGPRLGRYPVLGTLGEGGMGSVLEVEDPELGRRMAAKVIRGQADAMLLHKFVVEAQVTGQLEHPGIVPLHELGRTAEGQLYFTMKRVEGRTLESLLDDREPSLLRLVQIFLKVCDAVAFAHSRGVIHRDLTPANVMVGQFGEVQVMDWGLARRLREAPEGAGEVARAVSAETGGPVRTLAGQVMGTPAYMPPEQARGEVDALDERSDVYALGAILYQIATRHPPYAAEGAHDVLSAVLAGPPPPPSARAAGRAVPWELEAVVQRAMERERDRRYPGVPALKADLEAWLEGRAISAATYSPGQLAAKWAGRHRYLVSGASLALCTALVSGAIGFQRVQRQRDVARQRERDAVAQQALADENARRADRNAKETRAQQRYFFQAASIQQLMDLEAEASALWPAWPEKAEAMQAWLVRAEELSGQLPAVRRALAELRARGIASTQDRWVQGVLAELVGRLDAFTKPDPWNAPLASVRQRLTHARSIDRRSVQEHGAAWERAAASIADPRQCPMYRGLRLRPQRGLVPIGRDPDSGLWEFSHLETGAVARRGADQRIVVTGEMGLVFVLVPGGTFTMGAVRPSAERREGAPNVDRRAEQFEDHPHKVQLDPYFLSKYEMTQGQWRASSGANPSVYVPGKTYQDVERPLTLAHPVEQVSWDMCQEHLQRLELLLPTEAQWEHAARGGTTTPWWTGDAPATLQDAANLADRTAKRAMPIWHCELELEDRHVIHAPVGSFRPNPFGIHDTAGNVWEWCREDRLSYTLSVQAGTGLRLAPGGADTQGRVVRGGGFEVSATYARSAYRQVAARALRSYSIGLRPARAILH